MSGPSQNGDLPVHVVTEVVTLVRVWRVRAVDVGDAVRRVEMRSERGWKMDSPPERVGAKTTTRWAGASAEDRARPEGAR